MWSKNYYQRNAIISADLQRFFDEILIRCFLVAELTKYWLSRELINPLIYEKCGSDMRIVAFVMDPEQIDKILKHLIKQGRAPPAIAITQSSAT